MESYQNNRLVRKFFKCKKCRVIDGKLVNPLLKNIYCSKCSSLLTEIPEIEYKKYKNKQKLKNQKEDIKEEVPFKPNEDLLKRASGKYNNRPPSNKHHHHHHHHHKDSSKENHKHGLHSGKHKSNKESRPIRNQSSTHYSNMNFNNQNNYNMNNNYNNIRQNRHSNHNNINQINFVDGENNNNYIHQRREEHRHGERRRREHSSNPSNSNNFFVNFFRGLGFHPIMNIEFSIESPFMNNRGNPFRIVVQRQNVPNDIFDPIFLSFGSLFNGAFQDNYSSNFSSNYRGNFLNEILQILERNQAEANKKAHPPTSEEALNKLKKFSMTEKYCKKSKNGKYELPNCCICLSEIGKGEKTVLLPCGHMFHWKCCLPWLKSNNTCPMCRFEIK